MKKVQLGKTGENLSALCLGCLQFGSRDSKELSYQLLDHYYESGGNFLDTANNYVFWLEGFYGGESETVVGEWMKDRKTRHKMFLATKVGAKPKTKGGSWDDMEGLSAKVIEQQIDESLKRLQTDYIDLYYAHIDDRNTPLEETLLAFDKLVKSGKVKHIGCSNMKTWRIAEARKISDVNNLVKYCCVQQRYTYLSPNHGLDTGIQEDVTADLLDYSNSNDDFSIITYSPLLWGGYVKIDREIPQMYRSTYNQERLNALYKVAMETGTTPNQVVLAWHLQHKPELITITATGSMKQLKENLNTFNLTLSSEHLNYLDKAGNN